MSDEPEALGNVRRLRRKQVEGAQAPPAAAAEETTQGEMTFLPYGCPVLPIGKNGDVFYYLDQLGQLCDLKAKDHSRLNILHLFGRKKDLLYEFWPRKTQNKNTMEWDVTGWRPELAQDALMAECAELGVWSVEEKVRGAGAWRGRDGELILHCGDELLMVPAGEEKPASGWLRRAPGLVDGLVYPTGAPGLKPHSVVQLPGAAGPAGELLALLETWNWRRKGVDAHLLLGWIGAAMLGGALDWRVMAWITGGKNTGKSTLSNAIKWVMGDHGMLQSSDASAPSIRQMLKFAARPVALDEAESEEDGRKMQALVKLARDAASGSITYRGGQDHQASAFTVRSCFLFSSILIPPLLSQDRSRIAVLELGKIEASGKAKSLALTPRKMEELGARLLRRLVGQWARFPVTLEAYRAAMAEAGHSARGQDLFGTLLACADLLLSDGAPHVDVLAGWSTKLRAADLAEIEGDVSDENACLGYLLSTLIDNPRDRIKQSIGQWIYCAAGKGDPVMSLEELTTAQAAMRSAEKLLLDHGIKIVVKDGVQHVAIANMHRGLMKIYEKTQWAARAGAQGVWVQALRRLPHEPSAGVLWFGSASRATLLPIELCMPSSADGYTPPPVAPDYDDADRVGY